MNTIDTNTIFDMSFSDNSHILGRPIKIYEGFDGHMDIPILDEDGQRSFKGLDEWIAKTHFLDRAGIEMHLHYSK